MQTHSGQMVDLLDPQPETLLLQDIAHHLAMTCRFGGATTHFYSVAEHSILVLDLVDAIADEGAAATREERAWALLHDAAEAYIGDIVSPVRAVLGAPMEALERRIMRALCVKHGLPEEMPEIVRVADELALALEAQRLLGVGPQWPVRHVPMRLMGCGRRAERVWPPMRARDEYERRVRRVLL